MVFSLLQVRSQGPATVTVGGIPIKGIDLDTTPPQEIVDALKHAARVAKEQYDSMDIQPALKEVKGLITLRMINQDYSYSWMRPNSAFVQMTIEVKDLPAVLHLNQHSFKLFSYDSSLPPFDSSQVLEHIAATKNPAVWAIANYTDRMPTPESDPDNENPDSRTGYWPAPRRSDDASNLAAQITDFERAQAAMAESFPFGRPESQGLAGPATGDPGAQANSQTDYSGRFTRLIMVCDIPTFKEEHSRAATFEFWVERQTSADSNS